MKTVLKLAGKILLFAIGGVISLLLLVLISLNIAKFVIYGDYYSIKEDVITNPGLHDGFVCQGLCVTDSGKEVFFVSGYMADKSASRIYATETNNTRYVSLKSEGKDFTGHAGGIATAHGKLYVASESRVYTIPIEDVLQAKNGDSIDIGTGAEVNNAASFIFSDGRHIFVGEFHDGGAYTIKGHENETAEGTHSAIMTVYNPDEFDTPLLVYSIRNKVQGFAMANDGTVVLSTSYGLSDSVYYVYDIVKATNSQKTFDGAPLYYLDDLKYEIKGPAMAEGVDVRDGKFITLTESASNKYIFGKFFFADKIVSLDIKK